MAVSKLICSLWFAASVGASGHGHVHGNKVCFKGRSAQRGASAYDLSVSFMLTDKVITEGQPWGHPVIETDGHAGDPCLKIGAGRKSSKEVGRDFMSGLSFANVLGDSSFTNNAPETLHFYVEGTLGMNFAIGSREVMVECPSIRLAQGYIKHEGGFFPMDPWWIGSRSCSRDHGFFCECSNGAQVRFSPSLAGEDYVFDVELIRRPDAQWMQQDAVSEFGNGSAALAAAAAPRLALEGNSTKLRGSLNNHSSQMSAARERIFISEASSATATAVPAWETTSNNDTVEAIFYP